MKQAKRLPEPAALIRLRVEPGVMTEGKLTLQAGKNRESYSCDDRVDAGLRLHDEAECKIVIAKSLGAQKCADHELVDPEIEIVDASFTHLVHAETDKPPEIHGLNSPAGPP